MTARGPSALPRRPRDARPRHVTRSVLFPGPRRQVRKASTARTRSGGSALGPGAQGHQIRVGQGLLLPARLLPGATSLCSSGRWPCHRPPLCWAHTRCSLQPAALWMSLRGVCGRAAWLTARPGTLASSQLLGLDAPSRARGSEVGDKVTGWEGRRAGRVSPRWWWRGYVTQAFRPLWTEPPFRNNRRACGSRRRSELNISGEHTSPSRRRLAPPRYNDSLANMYPYRVSYVLTATL